MKNITILGAGIHGVRMAARYHAHEKIQLHAVISRRKPDAVTLTQVPYFASARKWEKAYGHATDNDVFDLCVHQEILLPIIKECIAIGVRNFILPKPLALTRSELMDLESLVDTYHLKVMIASQWCYASIVHDIAQYVREHQGDITKAVIMFSRPFGLTERPSYTSLSAFLPHILQIAMTAGLINSDSVPEILHISRESIRLRYAGPIEVHIESNLSATEKVETIKLYGEGKRPLLDANLAGVSSQKGFVTSWRAGGKQHSVIQDVLDVATNRNVEYFHDRALAGDLTFKKYLPIARAIVRVAEESQKQVVVIGGGIFGIMSALKVAERGLPVVVLEKEPQILTGASLVNQCRVHMGYHYPRARDTAQHTLDARDTFEKLFAPAIRRINNYYLIASEGSRVSPEEYLNFCTDLKLPYERQWPARTRLNRGKFSLSLKVPEHIFDAHTLRSLLLKKVAGTPNVTLLTGASVTCIERAGEGFVVEYVHGNLSKSYSAGAIINATYAQINQVNQLAGVPAQQYQYELCEMIVADTPWRGVGWAILDGPFFGVMPFGHSKEYLLYDVELSVLERSVGMQHDFAHTVQYYDTPERRANRFKKWKHKWKSYAPEIEQCVHLRSMYVVRTVLPRQDKTDARPTISTEVAPGLWQVFSGKITTSVPVAEEVAREVESFLNNRFRI